MFPYLKELIYYAPTYIFIACLIKILHTQYIPRLAHNFTTGEGFESFAIFAPKVNDHLVDRHHSAAVSPCWRFQPAVQSDTEIFSETKKITQRP